MKTHPLIVLVPLVAFLAVAGVLFAWYRGAASEVSDLERRVPLEWARPKPGGAVREPDRHISGPGEPADLMGSWPQFRGPGRDGIARYDGPLATPWPQGGPRVLWRTTVGEGYAGPAIHNGRVYLVDYDREASENAVRCLSLADGREIWRYTFQVKVKRNHGMSRTVAAVNDRYVVAVGPLCNVRCLDAVTGELKWTMDMVEEFAATVPQWYTGQCPLIEYDRVILAPGGPEVLMTAVALEDRKPLWTVPNPRGWKMTHSSVVPAKFGGVEQYVYCAGRGVVGVAADDGRVLWQWDKWWIANATAPSPVVIAPDRLLFTGDYGAGSQMVRVTREGEDFKVEEVFRLAADEFSCKQQTPIALDGYVYTILPKGQAACVDLSGTVLWTSPAAVSSGWGPFLFVGSVLYVLDDSTGELVASRSGPAGYEEIARVKVLEGREAWAPMAFADGRLIVRDMAEMVCLDLRPAAAVAEEVGDAP